MVKQNGKTLTKSCWRFQACVVHRNGCMGLRTKVWSRGNTVWLLKDSFRKSTSVRSFFNSFILLVFLSLLNSLQPTWTAALQWQKVPCGSYLNWVCFKGCIIYLESYEIINRMRSLAGQASFCGHKNKIKSWPPPEKIEEMITFLGINRNLWNTHRLDHSWSSWWPFGRRR